MGRRSIAARGWLLGVLVFVAVLAIAVIGLNAAGRARQDEALQVLSDSLQRALISCYSIEGRYPDTLEHLVENYSVYIDRDRYTVYYSIYAENIMPDITIITNS